MLELVDKSLHQKAVTIEPLIILRWVLTSCAAGDDRGLILFKQGMTKFISITASIGNDIFRLEVRNQGTRFRDVMTLPICQGKPKRVDQRIPSHMDFGAEAASTPSNSVRFLPTIFFGAPAAQGCAQIMALSINRASISGSLATYASSFS